MDLGSSQSNTSASQKRIVPSSAPDVSTALPAHYRNRIVALVEDPERSPTDTIEALLELGTTLLDVQHGHLCRINPGLGKHTVVAHVGPDSTLQKGDTTDLGTTYCRRVITSSQPLLIRDAPSQGWSNDVAYETFGFKRYLGAKVLSGNRLFGTVCFSDPEAQPEPFSHPETEFVRAITQQIEHVLQEGRRDHPSLVSRGELEKRTRLLERVQDVTNVGGWELDLTSETLVWTEETYEIYELSHDHEPTLESALRYFEGDAQAELETALERCIEEGTSYDLQLPFVSAQGNHRWLRVRGIAQVEQGEVVRVTGTVQDITNQHKVEQELETARNQFQRLIENAEPIVFMIDRDGTILVSEGEDLHSVNSAPGELVGENVFDVFANTPEITRQLERALSGEPTSGTLELAETTLEVWYAPFEDAAGKPAGCVGMAADVTEQKEVQEALRQERDLLNRIFETSPLAIAVFNEDGKFVQVSGRAQEILGLEKEEVENRTFKDPEWDITTPDGTPVPEEQLPFAQVRETEEAVFGAEHTIEWPDGRRRLLSVSGAPLHDEYGAFVGAVFHIDDITERRNAKRNLQESERRFRSVFENAALGIALVDDEGRILEANSSYESMLGYDAGDLKDRHFNSITHPEDRAVGTARHKELVDGTRDCFQLEKRYLRKNGDVFWGHLTVSRLDGSKETQLVAMLEDVDTRKKQRDKLRQFRTVIEQAHEAVLILQGDPREKPGPTITYANPGFREMTGYEPDEATGQPLQILFGSETEAWVLDDLWTHLEEGQRHEGEAISYRKDGTPFVSRWSIAPVYDEQDTLIRWISVLRDVTEKREMGKHLIEVQDEERRRIDKEMHNEMGGLLTTLQMTVELSRREAEEDSDLTERFQEMEDLVCTLSSVSRTIARRLHPRVLDDHGLAAALNTMKDELAEHHDLDIDLRTEIEDGERFSTLVEMTTFRVIQEGLINVVRHAETGSAQVILNKVENQLRFHVIDEGIGFDPETEPDEHTYGLRGMAERIEHLNGDFEIDAAPGEGTRISATLPLSISSLPTE